MLPSQPAAIMPTDSPPLSGLPSCPSGLPPSSVSSASLAERLGLAGLAILPMPSTDIAATLHRLAHDSTGRSATQDTLIFYGATAAHIEALEKDEGRPWRITFFGEETAGLLFLRMPKPVHEIAHSHLFLRLWERVVQIGLRDDAHAIGASKYKGISTQGISTRIKEGDSGLRPDPPRNCGDHFPTLAIEVGNSESLPRLYMDKDWWFDNSGGPRGDVEVVLVVMIYHQTKRIVLELWHRGYQAPSQTVTITVMPHQHADKPFSLATQDLHTNWVITGAPLVIPFEHVFLRPRRGDFETDFVLSEEHLAKYAVSCWKAETTVLGARGW